MFNVTGLVKRLLIGRAKCSEELGGTLLPKRREQLLRNQSALWLKTRLLFTPGVVVTSVPWRLSSSARADRPAARAPGSVRKGEPGRGRRGTGQGSRPA